MKTQHWLVSVLILSCALVAQVLRADAQLESPAAAGKTTKKRAATGAKAAAAKPAEAEKAGPLTAPEPAVVTQKSVNVRGQAAINSEVVTRLKKGDQVTVLGEVTLKKPKADEPAKWYKIALPTNTFVWVNSSFIDPATKAVVPKRLNLRSGPGENYSIVGRIEKGTVVKEVETKGDWMKIEAPAESYGFVAAHLVERQPMAAPPTLAAAEPAKPPPPATPPTPPPPPPTTPLETNVVAVTPPPVAPPPETTPPTVATPPPTVTTPPPTPPTVTTPPEPPAVVTTPTTPTEPPTPAAPPEEIKRVVTREGIVKRSVSIQAPTYFELSSLDNKRTLDYLYSPLTNVVLKDFKGKRIIVTGEEGLDERWPNTPVLTVESLQEVP